jgi:hypothetical protein
LLTSYPFAAAHARTALGSTSATGLAPRRRWHNNRRLHTACHDLTPVEYEQVFYGHHPAQQTGEGLNTLSLRTRRGGSLRRPPGDRVIRARALGGTAGASSFSARAGSASPREIRTKVTFSPVSRVIRWCRPNWRRCNMSSSHQFMLASDNAIGPRLIGHGASPFRLTTAYLTRRRRTSPRFTHPHPRVVAFG